MAIFISYVANYQRVTMILYMTGIYSLVNKYIYSRFLYQILRIIVSSMSAVTVFSCTALAHVCRQGQGIFGDLDGSGRPSRCRSGARV